MERVQGQCTQGHSAAPHGVASMSSVSLEPPNGPKREGFFTMKTARLREAGLLTQGHTAQTRPYQEISVPSRFWGTDPDGCPQVPYWGSWEEQGSGSCL